ncbi:MAG: ferritin-like domain-containing protein [Bacteroidota bacterium]
MKYLKNLKELMTIQLRSLYLGDIHVRRLLTEFIEKTTEPTLKEKFKAYATQSADQVIILKRVFNDIYEQKRGGTSDIIISMIDAAKHRLINSKGKEIQDAIMILSIQKIIHHKIVLLGAICTYGKLMGFYEDVSILHHELDLEKKMDRDLAMIAESIVDVKVPQYT